MEKVKNNKETIYGALGLSEEWKNSNESHLNNEIVENDTLSSTLLEAARRLKEEEFGEGDYKISDYERKLLITGIQISDLMMKVQAERAKALLAAVLGFSHQDGRTDREQP